MVKDGTKLRRVEVALGVHCTCDSVAGKAMCSIHDEALFVDALETRLKRKDDAAVVNQLKVQLDLVEQANSQHIARIAQLQQDKLVFQQDVIKLGEELDKAKEEIDRLSKVAGSTAGKADAFAEIDPKAEFTALKDMLMSLADAQAKCFERIAAAQERQAVAAENIAEIHLRSGR